MELEHVDIWTWLIRLCLYQNKLCKKVHCIFYLSPSTSSVHMWTWSSSFQCWVWESRDGNCLLSLHHDMWWTESGYKWIPLEDENMPSKKQETYSHVGYYKGEIVVPSSLWLRRQVTTLLSALHNEINLFDQPRYQLFFIHCFPGTRGPDLWPWQQRGKNTTSGVRQGHVLP